MSTFKRAICVSNDYNGLKNSTLHVLTKLWGSDIRLEVYIFGNSDLNPYDKRKDDLLHELRSKIYDKFLSFLIDKDYIDHDEKVIEKLPLISLKEYTGDKIDLDVVKDKQGLLGRHEDCINLWNDIQTYDFYEQHKEEIECLTQKLCDDLCEGLEDNSAIVLDLWLLDGDFNRLIPIMNDDVDIPMLSMGLYNALKRKNRYNVFLYSGLAIFEEFPKRWARTYTRMYNNSSNLKDELIIYTNYGKDFANLNSTERLNDKIAEALA